MCGIVTQFSSKKASLVEVNSMLDKLTHRGPDESTSWLSSCEKVAMAHARLTLTGKELGVHPVQNEDGSITAVVNGEFYGYEAIRSELESKGHRFCSDTDSEILVHLYEEHGLNLFSHLNGEFAFVLWDGNTQEIIAARDRFGIKPLVYQQLNGK